MQVIDITGLIEEGMWYYGPPIDPPLIEEIASLDGPTKWLAHKMTFTSITGTYLEANSHVRVDGETIDNIDVHRFIVPATLLHLGDIKPRQIITAEQFEKIKVKPQKGDALLFSTCWEIMWNKKNYIEDSPHLSLDATEWLLNTEATIIGSDLPAFDSPIFHTGIVEKLFSKNILLLGPLINLRQVFINRLLLIALPLKIKGVCGTPCRALLIDGLVD